VEAQVDIALADREAEIMQVLWTLGASTVVQVRAQLRDELAYTTVLTMLRSLEAKGYVAHKEEGRAHRYAALITREAAQRSAVRTLATKLFKGSSALLMSQLVSDEALSDEDIRRIRRLLTNHGKRRLS
jgi:BlaI family penicillinase repressor